MSSYLKNQSSISKTLAGFLLIASPTISGCRIGNQVQASTNPVSVRYYQTTPTALTFCATPSSNSSMICKPVSLTKIPSMIGDVMTQPVALVVDQSKNQAALVGLTPEQLSLPTTVNPDNTIEFIGETAPTPAWLDSRCTTQLWVQERDGKISPLLSGEPTTAILNSSSGQSRSVELSGHLELSFDVIQTFTGECTTSLQAMHDCYANSNDCGGANARENTQLQALVQSYFEDAIQAGVLASADIATVTQVSYSVSYQ
jgi:hypothetical protein